MKLRYCFAAALILFAFVSSSFATGLYADLSVEQPADGFYEAGEQFTVTLLLTDDSGNNLRVDQYDQDNIVNVQLWLSGPRQDFNALDPYAPLVIVRYFGEYDPEAGFDPETGQITMTLPEELPGSGSYAVMFKCQRRIGNTWWTVYPKADIPVNQVRPTFTTALRYMSCYDCHDAITHHGTSNLEDCLICHAHNQDDVALSSIYHELHDQHNVTECSDCHRASAGINNMGATPCYTCHSMPGNHSGFPDSQCSHCHSAYNIHGQPSPTLPLAFNLLEPEDSLITEDPITFIWETTSDNDANDEILYYLEIATDETFQDIQLFETGSDTQITLDDEDFIYAEDYFWRVWASDLNTQGRYSSQIRTFRIDENEVNEQSRVLPGTFTIYTPYPNPFNATTRIAVTLPETNRLHITIFSVNGRVVATLTDSELIAGTHTFSFNADRLPSGLYFAKAECNGQIQTVKMILLR